MTTRYEKLERIGKGGQGAEYRGREVTRLYEREVALKYMSGPEGGAAEVFQQNFENEARVCALLKHTNIVQLHGFGEDDEGSFLVFPLIESALPNHGPDLKKVIDVCGRLPEALAAFITHQVLLALDYAHVPGPSERRVSTLHRDISPDNILIDAQGEVKLADFGIARMYEEGVSQTQVLVGKIGYFSPERLDLEDIDGRADIFALGAVLYEMLAGTRLFGTREDGSRLSEEATARQILRTPIVPPVERGLCSQAISDVCMAMLSIRCADRPTAARALALVRSTGVVPHNGQGRLLAWLQDGSKETRFITPPRVSETASMRPRALASVTHGIGTAQIEGIRSVEDRRFPWGVMLVAMGVSMALALAFASTRLRSADSKTEALAEPVFVAPKFEAKKYEAPSADPAVGSEPRPQKPSGGRKTRKAAQIAPVKMAPEAEPPVLTESVTAESKGRTREEEEADFDRTFGLVPVETETPKKRTREEEEADFDRTFGLVPDEEAPASADKKEPNP